VFDASNYTFGVKEALKEREQGSEARFRRMRERHEKDGLRRTVRGVLLAHQHGHPVVFLLQDVASGTYSIPGGRMAPGEDEAVGLVRRLDAKLRPPPPPPPELREPGDPEVYDEPRWDVRESLAQWWRPHFDAHVYPYLPVHVSRPAECTRLVAVGLPQRCAFGVPRNLRLISVPLYDLHANEERFGPIIASIPLLISRYNIVCH
jgi:cleavage and polyadenylation specificity factor subunit 5